MDLWLKSLSTDAWPIGNGVILARFRMWWESDSYEQIHFQHADVLVWIYVFFHHLYVPLFNKVGLEFFYTLSLIDWQKRLTQSIVFWDKYPH